ncbi:hypothetical protein F4802DRAFT_326385 [Xylaria palmicola]|nr:hypothetical protein F4802DRAFT_326385 [Xylaria palmicola]
MSRYEDGYPPRGRASDLYSYSTGGTTTAAPPAYTHIASPGHSTYNGKPQARLTYEPLDASYAPRSSSAGLQVPESRSRPRSLPPPIDPTRSGGGTRERGDNKYGDSDDSDDGRTRSPMEKARRFVDSTFTDSTTGLGVGVLGALVGGLAAREAVDLTSNRQQKGGGHGHGHGHGGSGGGDDDAEHKRAQLIGTVVGAAVGALGANAVEKRIEVRRARDEARQDRWERKWRRPDGHHGEILEKMEVVAGPRSRGHSLGGGGGGSGGHHRRAAEWGSAWDERDGEGGGRRSSSRRGVEREVDPGARSWRNVEDWLLDEGEDGAGQRRDSHRR